MEKPGNWVFNLPPRPWAWLCAPSLCIALPQSRNEAWFWRQRAESQGGPSTTAGQGLKLAPRAGDTGTLRTQPLSHGSCCWASMRRKEPIQDSLCFWGLQTGLVHLLKSFLLFLLISNLSVLQGPGQAPWSLWSHLQTPSLFLFFRPLSAHVQRSSSHFEFWVHGHDPQGWTNY